MNIFENQGSLKQNRIDVLSRGLKLGNKILSHFFLVFHVIENLIIEGHTDRTFCS